LKLSENVFPKALGALLLLLSTDVKKFFRAIKKIFSHAWKNAAAWKET